MNLAPRDIYVGCFCSVHGWGGALTGAETILATARGRGLATLLLGATAKGDDLAALATDVAAFDVPVPAEPLLWRLRSWRIAGQLATHLRTLPPPGQAFVARSPYWAVAAKSAWPRTRVVYLVPCILRHCLPFTWPNGRPPGLWAWADYRGTARVERQALTRSDLVLTYTACQRDEIAAEFGVPRERIQAFRAGLPASRRQAARRDERRSQLGLPADAFVLLGVGVLDSNKAFDFAIRALPAMDARAHLVIVGDGPQRSALEQLAASLGLAERVHLVGGQREMAGWYAAADCVVSTSFYESYGHTLPEGMCHGRPALVPRHCPPEVYAGFAEVIATHGGGLVYDRSRPEALAASVNRLIRDREFYDRLSKEAAEFGRQEIERTVDMDAILGVKSGAVETPRCVTSDNRPTAGAPTG